MPPPVVTPCGVYMLVRRKIFFLLPLMAGLGACTAGDGRYPSLAMRDFEIAPPAPAAAPPAPIRPVADAALLGDLRTAALRAHAGFTRHEAEAARLARRAAGQPIESDTRAAALVAMADLAAERGATSAVLADLDRLAAEAATTFAPTGEIETARTEVLALVTSQDAAMARLWEIMGQ